ncbi:hypothetical protein JCM3774_001001 [Rhodotorula dairenensis]
MSNRQSRGDMVAVVPSSRSDHAQKRWHLLLPEGFHFATEQEPPSDAGAVHDQMIETCGHVAILRAGDDKGTCQPDRPHCDRRRKASESLLLHLKLSRGQATPELRPSSMADQAGAELPYTAVLYPQLEPTAVFSALPITSRGAVALMDRQQSGDKPAGSAPSPLLCQAVALAFSDLLSYNVPGVGSLSDLTCTGRQLRIRIEQLCAAWEAEQAPEGEDRSTLCRQHALRISRLNLLWTCLNDVIVGLALGSIIRENRPLFLSAAETFVRTYVLGYLRNLLHWLSSWPVGIKLNDEIADVICRAFLGLSNLWEHVCLEPILAHLPIGLIGLTGIFGASTLIGLIADFLSVLTLPFFACYVAAAFTFRQSFSMLLALFDVFRGRKYNPLRSRTEPATYEVDELLLGTILFVMLSAIFPTIAAFYLAFASSRLLLLSSQAFLITTIGALNAFPLFMLLLRLKSPHRLPGGAELAPCHDHAHWPEPHLHLRVHTMPYSGIFASLSRKEYSGSESDSAMAGHTSSTSVLVLCLLAIFSVTTGAVLESAPDVASGLSPFAAVEIDHRLETRSGPASESYLHRSRPSRYEGTASAATLLRNAQLKAAAVDAGRSSKMKNVAFRAATIKAAIAHSYARRHHGKISKTRRSSSSAGQSEDEAGEADLDARAVERARRNVSNRPSIRRDHRAKPRSPQHLVEKAALVNDATRRQGKDRFRPREITKQRGRDAERPDRRRREARMETRMRGAASPQ